MPCPGFLRWRRDHSTENGKIVKKAGERAHILETGTCFQSREKRLGESEGGKLLTFSEGGSRRSRLYSSCRNGERTLHA